MATNSWTEVPKSVREALRDEVFARDGYRCQVRGPRCTGAADELDHVIPREMGGAILDPANCRASCLPCNRGRRPGREAPRAAVKSSGPSRSW